jgi:hypothetical protein
MKKKNKTETTVKKTTGEEKIRIFFISSVFRKSKKVFLIGLQYL